MGPSQIPKKTFSILFLFLSSFLFPINLVSSSSEQLTNFVYKGCANQKFPSGFYSQTLNTLFNNLVSQSLTTKFYKTTAGSGSSAISGLFQCRGDLSNSDCNNCVKKIPNMSQKLCGESIAARIQLNGCYLRYEVAGFQTVGPTELLFKVCGSTQASGTGFSDKLETALGEISKGVSSGNGFYAGGYQSVYVLGQCEGDLESGDCVNCVKNAVGKAKSECGNSISAHMYLQQCYISYTYYPNGVPGKSLSPSGTRQSTQKTVAIVLGGMVGVGLGVACLLVTRSAFKKKSKSKYGGG
ncbi:plasmodesmata-located protein 2-like [Nicotiana tabacum]|uniref:Cysteine-rich repeat secretory protein 3-like n=2 Tax=Nicotiana tabacum TaxID=4097 RepID=A0A1S3XG98_TOBAC|nr:plasmodesmata-located protein 2 [Nicotiana tomentosiformis]XP_016438834.1 PREDICTED: cysteine-rich repeat secretory protein 3-like [Nicotiana tabacum]XP_033516399.1 plasmodesmata-located protein 2 [Nicotiana tomentosiformis]